MQLLTDLYMQLLYLLLPGERNEQLEKEKEKDDL
jgi:hypothetical protein